VFRSRTVSARLLDELRVGRWGSANVSQKPVEPALVAADIRALRDISVGSIDFGFGGSTADEVLAAMQKFRAEVLPLV